MFSLQMAIVMVGDDGHGSWIYHISMTLMLKNETQLNWIPMLILALLVLTLYHCGSLMYKFLSLPSSANMLHWRMYQLPR
jgi:hypothetical protein